MRAVRLARRNLHASYVRPPASPVQILRQRLGQQHAYIGIGIGIGANAGCRRLDQGRP